MKVNITITVENVENHKKLSKTVENVVASFTRSSTLFQATDVKCYFHKQNEKTLNHQYDKIDATEINLESLKDESIESDTVTSEVKTDNANSETKQEIKKILSKKQAKKAIKQALRV
jgi:hypothetical protein